MSSPAPPPLPPSDYFSICAVRAGPGHAGCDRWSADVASFDELGFAEAIEAREGPGGGGHRNTTIKQFGTDDSGRLVEQSGATSSSATSAGSVTSSRWATGHTTDEASSSDGEGMTATAGDFDSAPSS